MAKGWWKRKTTMCNYGSCRVEWNTRGDKADGPRKYCEAHAKIMFKVSLNKAQKAYRKRSAKIIAQRNAEFRRKNPNYMKEYHAKRKQLNKSKDSKR